jgi:hypothetical protein
MVVVHQQAVLKYVEVPQLVVSHFVPMELLARLAVAMVHAISSVATVMMVRVMSRYLFSVLRPCTSAIG